MRAICVACVRPKPMHALSRSSGPLPSLPLDNARYNAPERNVTSSEWRVNATIVEFGGLFPELQLDEVVSYFIFLDVP